MKTIKPMLFAVYSVWGNQWLKLAMFMQEWCRDINVLVSTDSVLNSSVPRYEAITKYGLSKGFIKTREEYREFMENTARKFPYLSNYLDEFEKPLPKMTSLFMLDSGGYGFTKAFEGNNIRNQLRIRIPDLYNCWKHGDEKSQDMVLEKQQLLKPDILITLDKVIFPNELAKAKKEKIGFSLKCAKIALQRKKEGIIGNTALFAAVHGYGPSPNNGPEKYYDNTREYMNNLLSFESEVGVRFDGFSIGSLVPISNEQILSSIANAVRDVLGSERRKTAVHGLGASTDNKISTLYKCGVRIFDTNLHMKNARNRLIYHPTERRYVSTKKIKKEDWECDCKICSNYTWDILNENRRRVREVSTVLISLHNLYTDHLRFLETLR
ncbi:MAG: tRNA-guanine transglycosylase [Candidatus Bathyarchaeia archaeon]